MLLIILVPTKERRYDTKDNRSLQGSRKKNGTADK